MKINLNLLLQKEGFFCGPYMLPCNEKQLNLRLFQPLAPSARTLAQVLMRVHVILLLLGFCLTQVNAFTYGQQITIKTEKGNLESILKELEKQSGYTFFYKKDEVTPVKNMSVDMRNVPFEKALDIVLKKADFNFDLFGKTIVLKKSPLVTPMIRVRLPETKTEIDAQLQQFVRGKVIDENGEPIVGASVRLKSNPVAVVVSGEAGVFILPLTTLNEIILISYLGYETRELKASLNPNQMVVRLKKQEEKVDEVVVTGIFKKPMESFTGSATTVTAEELQRFGTRNLITSLRNIDPSFNIIESNTFGSNPNRLPEIQVRGNSNIPNVTELQDQSRTDLNTPLIILDGFESTLRKLYDLNENEVETITLLKDASATAMYGSRGANGVVIITTRAPQPGKLRLTYRIDGNAEIADLTDYNLMKSREKLELERLAGYYNSARAESDLPLKRYYNWVLNEVNSGVETDWLSQPVRNGIGQRHNLRIDGGHEAFRYSASGQYNDIQGTMKGSSRGTFNGNITLSYVYNNLRFQNNTQIADQRTAESPYGSFGDYARLNPYWRIYDENGDVLKRFGYPGNTDYSGRWGATLPTNPLYNAMLNTFDKTKMSELTNNTVVEWNVISGLIARARFGTTKSVSQSDRFRPGDHTAFANYSSNDVFRKGDYRYGVGNTFRYDGSLTLQYDKRFGKHTIFTGLDYNIRQSNSSNYSFLVEGFSNANLDFLSMALQYQQGGKPSGSESLVRSVGFTGNGSYVYDNRYFTDLSVRLDGSSQFGSNRRFAPFWSFGLGWNIHQEEFLKGNLYVNRLRLRGSLGTTGSQAFNAYQALSTYQYYTDDRYFNWNGTYLMGLGNPNLVWQTNFKNNIGLDGEFFGRTLRVIADYYIETTEDLVSSINLPLSNGFSSYVENIGSLRNKGFELKSTVFVIDHSQLTWSLTGAVIQNKNKILETSQALKDAQEAIRNGQNNYAARIFEEGYSSNAIWAVRSIGIDPSNGKELFLGMDGLPTYIWRGSDVVAVGNTDPKFFGNFSTFLRYKDLSLNLSFGYRFGGQQYNQTLVNRVESSDYNYNVDARVYDSRWKGPGDNAAFKGILVTEQTRKTSRFVQDENTLQLQNVNFQYNLRAKQVLSSMGLQSLNFAANFADAFHLSTVRRERGLSYPFARQLSFNISATF